MWLREQLLCKTTESSPACQSPAGSSETHRKVPRGLAQLTEMGQTQNVFANDAQTAGSELGEQDPPCSDIHEKSCVFFPMCHSRIASDFLLYGFLFQISAAFRPQSVSCSDPVSGW